MRAIAFFLVAILSAGASEARADGCQAAIARYNQAVITEAKTFVAAFQKVFGITPAAYKTAYGDAGLHTPEFCLKSETMMQARLSGVEASLALWQAVQSACAKTLYKRNPVKGAPSQQQTAEQGIAFLKTQLADCAGIIGAANAGSVPAPALSDKAATPNAPQNQAAHCPDDVGPGMLLTNPGISLEGSTGCNNRGATNPQLPGAPRKDEVPNMQGEINPQNRAPEVPGVSPPSPPLPSDNSFGAAPSTAEGAPTKQTDAPKKADRCDVSASDLPQPGPTFDLNRDVANPGSGGVTCPPGCHRSNETCVLNP